MSNHLYNAFANEKAGMKAVDRDLINAKIAALTKGTPKSKKDEEDRRKTIDEMAESLKKLSEMKSNPEYYSRIAEMANNRINSLNRVLNMTKRWLHIDMDAFYAAVEMRDNPKLRDKAVAVGGKDMVAASNYEARKYGVRSAMPAFIAKELCPHLVLVNSNMAKYKVNF